MRILLSMFFYLKNSFLSIALYNSWLAGCGLVKKKTINKITFKKKNIQRYYPRCVTHFLLLLYNKPNNILYNKYSIYIINNLKCDLNQRNTHQYYIYCIKKKRKILFKSPLTSQWICRLDKQNNRILEVYYI